MKSITPGKQYIIEQSPKPSNVRYLIDKSDLNYYRESLNNNITQGTIDTQGTRDIPVIPHNTFGILGTIGTQVMDRPMLIHRPRTHLEIFDRNGMNTRGNTQGITHRITQGITQGILFDINEYDDILNNWDIDKDTRENSLIKDEAIRKTVNDSQSVHDTVIQSATRHKYNKDSDKNKTTNKGDKQVVLEQIVNHNQEHKDKIKNIIDQISCRNSKVTNFSNDSEIDILVHVYSNGNENVKNQVINELLDSSKALGLIDCPTGVTTRIVNAKFIETPEDMPKSKSIIQQEMLQVASHFRDNYTGSDEKFKENLLQKYYSDYEFVMSREEIDDSVKPWIDAI